MEPERPWSLEAVVAETRAEVRGLRSEVGELWAQVRSVRGEIGELRTEVRSDIRELRHDVRRLDDRFFQMLVLQVGTLIAVLGSLVNSFLA